jgi:hypothetical protein
MLIDEVDIVLKGGHGGAGKVLALMVVMVEKVEMFILKLLMS